MSKLDEALKCSIIGFLKDRGIYPARVSGSNYFFYSPFHYENNPSLCVNVSMSDKELFKDFSTQEKMGDIVDFVSKLHGVSASEAIAIILEGEVIEIKKEERKPKGPNVIIENEGELKSPTLIKYITEVRGIKESIAKRYCSQAVVKFPNGKYSDRPHNFIAFRNNSGGYELRNQYLKVGTSPKTITTIEDYFRHGTTIVMVFEGFINFLSYLTHHDSYKPYYKTIILNGISNISFLPENNHYHLYIDNDYPADKALKEVSLNFTDMRKEFDGYNDYNKALLDNFRRTKINRRCLRSLG